MIRIWAGYMTSYHLSPRPVKMRRFPGLSQLQPYGFLRGIGIAESRRWQKTERGTKRGAFRREGLAAWSERVWVGRNQAELTTVLDSLSTSTPFQQQTWPRQEALGRRREAHTDSQAFSSEIGKAATTERKLSTSRTCYYDGHEPRHHQNSAP